MKRYRNGWRVLALGVTLVLGAAARAEGDVAELARDRGCFSCHSVEQKLVGPAFVSVAEKYAGQPDAAEELALSIRNGSISKWGRIPMPAHGSLAAEDVQRLATWVLSLGR
jgi:cytochrome c